MNSHKRKVLQGRVLSTKMNKSIVVAVATRIRILKYGKYVNRNTKITVHDENNSANVGNLVLIEESRPISKSKSWNLVQVIN